MHRRLWLGCWLMALLPGLAWAGRPLETEDPGTIAAGHAELEVSVDSLESDASRLVGAKGVLGVGLLPGMEARVESVLLRVEPRHAPSRGGMGDSLVGFKHRLLDETEALPALMYALTLRLPTGNAARLLGDTGVDATLIAVVGKTLGPVTLTWNGGYVFVSRDRALESWLLAASLDYRVSEPWSLAGEVVSTLGVDQAPPLAVLRLGSAYALSTRVKLDGAVGVGITRASPDVLLTVGVTLALF
jgi:hypothetical protein